MKQLFFLLSLMFALNIYSQTNTKTQKAVYVNINIDIAFKDKDGNDLLDPNTDNHFEAKDISLYNMVKGEKVKVNKPHMDHPNNQYIYKDDATKTNLLRVYLDAEVVLLQLNATTTDTIKCTLKKTKGNTHIEKVWYNGKLVWTNGKEASQVITIVK